MSHLFLTTPIASRLWMQFNSLLGTKIYGMHLKQLIITWWKQENPRAKSDTSSHARIYNVDTLEEKEYGGKTTYNKMVEQVQDLVRKLVNIRYPWIRLERR